MIETLGRQYAQKADAFACSYSWIKDAFDIARGYVPLSGVLVDLGCNTGRFLHIVKELNNS